MSNFSNIQEATGNANENNVDNSENEFRVPSDEYLIPAYINFNQLYFPSFSALQHNDQIFERAEDRENADEERARFSWTQSE